MSEPQSAAPITYDEMMAFAKRAKDADQKNLAYALCITAGATFCSGVAGFDSEAMLVQQLDSVDQVIQLMYRAMTWKDALAKHTQDDPERN